MKIGKLFILCAMAIAVAALPCFAFDDEPDVDKLHAKFDGGTQDSRTTIKLSANRPKEKSAEPAPEFKGGDTKKKSDAKTDAKPPPAPPPADSGLSKSDAVVMGAGALLGFFLLGPIGILLGAALLLGFSKMK